MFKINKETMKEINQSCHYRILFVLCITLFSPFAQATVKAEVSIFMYGEDYYTSEIMVALHDNPALITYGAAYTGSTGINPTGISFNFSSDGQSSGDGGEHYEFRRVNSAFTHTSGPIRLQISSKALFILDIPTSGNTVSISLDLPDGTPCPVLVDNAGHFEEAFTCQNAPLTIYTSTLDDIAIPLNGDSNQQTLIATGGVPPYHWFLSSLTGFPNGVTFPGGVIKGSRKLSSYVKPIKFNSYNFSIVVLDSADVGGNPNRATKNLSVKVVCGEPANNDTDNDGLKDCWEIGGIDSNNDGESDLLLQGLDNQGKNKFLEENAVNPLRKDIFVEIDWMENHKPDIAALNDVIQAFADAPIKENGTVGIGLHLELNEQALAHQTSLPIDGLLGLIQPCFSTPSHAISDIYEQSFGSISERSNLDALNAKKMAFRYAFFAHQYEHRNNPEGKSTGVACLRGRDLLVTMGGLAPTAAHYQGTEIGQSGTFMHELGHTLGLKHGGGDGINCKPNYLSVMSYSRQLLAGEVGIPLDFSAKYITLDETNLDEHNGITGSDSASIKRAKGQHTIFSSVSNPISYPRVPADGPIDWDRGGNAVNTGIKDDINKMPNFSCDGDNDFLSSNLVGHDDWKYIAENLKDVSPGALSAGATISELAEEGNPPLGNFDTDGDGVLDTLDNCTMVHNPDQLFADGTAVGEACKNPPVGDFDKNMKVDCDDLKAIAVFIGSERGDGWYKRMYDLNNNSLVNVKDLQIVAQALPAGTVCQ